MARTRSKPAAKVSKETIPPETIAPAALPPSAADPPRLFILPKDTSPDSRIVTLSHPATATPTRYYFCPEKGFYEFTKIAAPRSSPRSWLLAPPRIQKTDIDSKSNAAKEDTASVDKGYITKSADLFIATPLDILFLLLPALAPKSTPKEHQKQLFLSLDDHLDTLAATSPHLRQLLRTPKLKERIAKRMESVADIVDAGDEKMYRLSYPRLVSILLQKAERMAANGLPASMEEKFVRSALDVPILDIPREDSGISVFESSEAVDLQSQTTTATTPTGDSQTTVKSETTEATSTTSLQPPAISAPEGIPHLLRLRTALSLLLSLVPPTLHTAINASLVAPTIDFTPLTTHLAHLSSLRQKSAALRSVSDNISRKRAFDEDADEQAEIRAEKRRKKEEDEKRKKSESRGLKQLRKADTSGMKKLSSFFTAKPAVKK
ncbi:uncharacterized protein BDZ99DRAFT_436934 [Mytilinidion resinicola]|uniref:Ribonuclease H2 subunit B n=1 Tax=Mytilinidion resinicola TaxID=574789 RepID=A0A6A6Z062_9PEZI|nr:uncharacterized protein BDZ99DRAFT_436934 [Mytilinidion resinicola]KAF2814168.1 hypothetical protein BDZ99DRAFT_436934 [Mytilinidion resinicola]